MAEMTEGEARAIKNAYDSYMRYLNEQWESVNMQIKDRFISMSSKIDMLEKEIKALERGIKNYKKTFTQCERSAREATEKMDRSRGSMYELLSQWPAESIEKVRKLCEMLGRDY